MAHTAISFGITLIFTIIVVYISTATQTSIPNMNLPLVHTIGTSHENRSIAAYTFGNGGKHVVFVGGMHGGYEANTVELSYALIEHLQHRYPPLLEGLQVTIIPVANPDGLHAVVGTTTTVAPEKGRFNARMVDLNRNFDCNWQNESRWGTQKVNAGTEAFSEKEAQAIRDFALTHTPDAFIFFHSKAHGVYASSCGGSTHEDTLALMHTYAEASGYPAYETFDSYPITGDAEGYLASIGIPALTVELSTHEHIEWEQNWNGVQAILQHIHPIN